MKKASAGWVCEELDKEYGILQWRSHGEPLEALMQTILSQATSDVNSGRAFDSLRRAFPGGWDEVRLAEVREIAAAIRCGGLADAKAPRLRAVLQEIYERVGTTDLEFLKTTPTEEAKAFLNSFHGVGPKTTACVLMFSLGRPVLPVDTHVYRVSHRLGLISEKLGEAKAHAALQSQLKDAEVYPYHVHLIRHGRRVCLAQQPRCEECVLAPRCAYRQQGGRMGKKYLSQNLPITLHGLKEKAGDGSNKA
ncbi:endonuclease III domain-containing protein [Armatimonas sp.]|uniref:endonuclease III domain-containing protein n=1 Tax=Armatimonas sp. TaxID=1872638 RepID=UPI0037536B31